MAEPDNVARLIAAASALAAAANGALSYATYRRKKPSLTFTAKLGCVYNTFDELLPTRARFDVKVRNRSETPLKIEGVNYEMVCGERPRPLLQRVLRRGREGTHSALACLSLHDGTPRIGDDLAPDTESFPIEVGGLQPESLVLYYPGCYRTLTSEPLPRGRVTVKLAGGATVSGPWARRVIEPCGCHRCRPPKSKQLTFDDLGVDT